MLGQTVGVIGASRVINIVANGCRAIFGIVIGCCVQAITFVLTDNMVISRKDASANDVETARFFGPVASVACH